jgi:multidrug efflux pump subunit AcrB
MDTAKFCIRHRVATLLAVILIAVFGIMFSTQLQMALMPDIEAPMAMVMCYYNGATPSDMEELVTRPLESAVLSVPGVDSVSSTSSDGVSQLQVTYVDGTNLDIAATKLREQFNRVSLPDGAMDPIIVNLNISELMPTAIIALKGDDLAQLQALAEDTVAPALERIDGVAQVTISGGVTQQVEVRLDAARAAGLGLSNSYVSQFLAGQNLIYPAGSVENGSKTLTVSTDAKFQSVDDVANTLITLPTGGTVRLKEVADVALVSQESDSTAKVDGTACVMLQVSKQSGANEVAAAEAVLARLESLSAENPAVQYTVPYIASDYINLSVDAAFQNIFQGLLLAAIVVFLFLRRGGATMTIVISMPVCILSVFILMNALGLTLNMMSLGGIAMGVGMIVDNSIVVLENIYRFAADGHDRMSACVEGTAEVTSSVLASTLTTLAVFVPLGLVDGIAGMMFRDFCLTIASLIFASLVIALTLVPLLCYFLLDEEKIRRQQLAKANKTPGPLAARASAAMAKLNALYMRLLTYFTYHLKAGMLVSVGLVVVFSLTLFSTKTVLIPDMDQGQVSISISMPIGSQADETAAIADQVSAVIAGQCPELEDMYYIAQDESATMMVNLVGKSERQRSSADVANDLRTALQDIAGCEITVDASSTMGMMSGSDINVEIRGNDYDTLGMIADDLTERISQLPDATEVQSSLSEQVPQVKVQMNREAAAQYGLTAASVGAAVRAELTGTTATTVTIDNKELDVVVKGDGAASASLDALRSMSIPSSFGGSVPLSAVANVTVEQAPQSIARANQSRQVTITGKTVSGDTTAMTQAIHSILAEYPMPEGYTAETAGSYEDMVESFTSLLLALGVALGLVYFVLAAQFESFLMPIMVMMILPVAFTGALFALPLTGRDLSMITLVAIIMLAGTVVNSSIILVEYIRIRRRRGEDRETAILRACPLRVRPVMMTTLTTILAMIPMALALGDTNEMMSDMGVTMISGMTISTIVTLVFTPVYYSVIDNLSHRFGKKKQNGPAAV